MRKLILLMLLGMLFLSCSNLKYLNKFGSNNGKPKMITSMTYDMGDISINGNDTIYNESVGKFISHYDKKGREIKNSYFSAELNKITSYTIFEYDNKGNKVHETFYIADSTIFYQISNVYNKKGQKVVREIAYKNGKKLTTEYVYDKNGNNISEVEFNKNSDFKQTSTMIYNDKGDVIEMLFYDKNNQAEGKILYSYDQNHLIEEKWYNSEGNLYEVHDNYKYDKHNKRIYGQTHSYHKNDTITKTSEFKFEYDNNKNIVKRTMISDGTTVLIIKRQIEYWEYL